MCERSHSIASPLTACPCVEIAPPLGDRADPLNGFESAQKTRAALVARGLASDTVLRTVDVTLCILDQSKILVRCRRGSRILRAAATTANQRNKDDSPKNCSRGSSRGPLGGPNMPLVQHGSRELHLKVVYYGPGLGGKTTNLEIIHRRSNPAFRGKLVSLEAEGERTLFFDLLPMELGRFRDYRVRLHLCTVPGQMALDRTRQMVLRNVDAIVFVADSQRGRETDNVNSLRNLETNLRLQEDDPERLPLVIQYNKRDMAGALPIDHLRRTLGIPMAVPQIEASALRATGVFETLKIATKAALGIVGDPHRAPSGRFPSHLAVRRPSIVPSFDRVAAA